MSDPSAIRPQLERILASPVLDGSDQLKRLLRLVVERTLEGKSDLLKEYNLGVEVFQRPPSYDPKVDPIVRVQARRLRSKLDEYYSGYGASDLVVIQIPKGAYVPVFEAREHSIPHASGKTLPHMRIAVGALAAIVVVVLAAWLARDRSAASAAIDRSIAVLPLRMFTEDNRQSHIADQVTEVLTTELAKNKQLRVLSRTTASKYRETKSSLPEIAKLLGVRWLVEGGVGLEGSRAYVKLRAVDSTSDRKVWADVFDCELAALVPTNTRAADNIASAIEARLRSQPE